jgi:hypothetical protein
LRRKLEKEGQSEKEIERAVGHQQYLRKKKQRESTLKKRGSKKSGGALTVSGSFTSGDPPGDGWTALDKTFNDDWRSRVVPNKGAVFIKKFTSSGNNRYFLWFSGVKTAYMVYGGVGSQEDIDYCDTNFGRVEGETWHHTGLGRDGEPSEAGNYMQQVSSAIHSALAGHVGGCFMAGYSKND